MNITAMININRPKGDSKVQRQNKLKSVMAPMALSMLAFLAANLAVAGDAPALKTKDVILVHGAWADGSSWSKVIALLQLRGFHVTAVQLSMTSVARDVATLAPDFVVMTNGAPELLATTVTADRVIRFSLREPTDDRAPERFWPWS